MITPEQYIDNDIKTARALHAYNEVSRTLTAMTKALAPGCDGAIAWLARGNLDKSVDHYIGIRGCILLGLRNICDIANAAIEELEGQADVIEYIRKAQERTDEG
jgi:hypothetical protein